MHSLCFFISEYERYIQQYVCSITGLKKKILKTHSKIAFKLQRQIFKRGQYQVHNSALNTLPCFVSFLSNE